MSLSDERHGEDEGAAHRGAGRAAAARRAENGRGEAAARPVESARPGVEVEQRNRELEGEIAERRQAEEALRENENLLRRIAESFPNSYISIIESNYTAGFSSGQEFRKRNVDPEQYRGVALEEVFGDKTPIVRRYYEKTFAGEEQSFELTMRGQHQHYRTVPLYSEDGSIPRILACRRLRGQTRPNHRWCGRGRGTGWPHRCGGGRWDRLPPGRR